MPFLLLWHFGAKTRNKGPGKPGKPENPENRKTGNTLILVQTPQAANLIPTLLNSK